MNRKQLDDIMNAVSPYLAPAGFECIEAEWDPQGTVLRLYVDRPGGVDMAACVEATRLLEEWSGLAGSYTLEVSSPGVERPLRRLQDFERYRDAEVSIRLSAKEGPAGSRRKGTGRLASLSEAGLCTMLLEEGGEWTFPFASIHKAHVVHRWDA